MAHYLKSMSLTVLLGAATASLYANGTTSGIAAQNVQHQGQPCTGVIVDENGESIIGASVQVEGSKTGAITDIDGRFTLPGVKNGDVITVSYIGFSPVKVKYAGKPINITMKDDTHTFGEVIVTGYGGQQKRGTITTAVSKVDNNVLKNAAFGNAGQALQGSVTGMRVVNTSGQPGTTPNIVLRGGATISGSNNNALVIVDGIVRNSMADVNPEDIESMQVLKDAASTAIYGARANGGVILIETKSGKKGKAQINYKFKIGMNSARKDYDFLNGHDYIYYNRLGMRRTNEAVKNYSNGWNVDSQMGDGVGNKNFDIRYLTDETKDLLNQGWLQMDDPYYDGTNGYDKRTILYRDYSGQLDDAFYSNNAMLMEHYVNNSGGSDKGTYSASMGYYDEDGQVKGTGFKRFTGNMSGSYQVLPFLKVRSSAQFMWSTAPELWTYGSYLFYRMRSARPTWNPYDADGNPQAGFGTSDGNPLYYRSKYHAKNSTTKSTYTIGATADIIKDHLILDANASLLNWDYQNETAWDAYQQQNWSSPNTARSMSAEVEKYHQLQTNATLTYKNVFAEKHDLNVMLGGEYYTYDHFQYKSGAEGAPTDDIHTINVASKFNSINTNKTAYRILSAFGRAEYNYDLKYLFSATFRYDGISRLDNHRWGFFPGVSFGWNVTQENFWKKSSLSDVITTLKPRVSYGTNGNVNGLGNYEVYGEYNANRPDNINNTLPKYDGASPIVNSGLVNSGLRWEQSHTFEAGLDIGFFNNRLSFIFDYYNRETKDLLTSLSLPGYTGFSSIRTNLGNLRNTGFEAEVRANIINKGGFRWDVTANITTVSNKILKLPTNSNARNRVGGYEVAAGRATQNADGTWNYSTKWVGGTQEGGKLGEITAYIQDHIFRDNDDLVRNANMRIDEVGKLYGPGMADQINPSTGKTYAQSSGWKPIEEGDVCWADLDGDGKITSYDRKVIGNYLPNVTGGFSTTLAYKGLSLYARFDYALGHTLYNDLLARSIGQYQGNFNVISEVKKTWSETNRDTDLPKFYYADQLAKYNITRSNAAGTALDNNNSRFYEKGDYLACRELTLSYQLPKRLLAKAFIQDASVYVTAQNLFYITGYSGTSPEPAVAGTNAVGVDSGRYPTPRTYLLGVSLTF